MNARPEREFAPRGILRNAHVQSLLTSSAVRRWLFRNNHREFEQASSEHLLDCGDGVRLQGFHARQQRLPKPRGLVVVLHGWEVKSLRAGKANLTDSYVIFKNGEAYLLGAQIMPLLSASTHVVPDPIATRKLLLNKTEIAKLSQAVAAKGYTVVALSLYWKANKVKVSIGLAKGKQDHDKRDTSKEREWQREKERAMKKHVR